ncbi:hypothetical protein D3H65_12205 [Paraflavitalea soli]|uniref:Tail specific protease domain-containing protein n=1 Tax=Paraflavitalea soli TaxID=2315862 RepID=A0A3B7MKJ6_9BACT|nr:S41 family peptidase [Paraflavitalea soli]AXY74698.1 hypothetical protein D3H65_12205 [Paraflavitalea soli]
MKYMMVMALLCLAASVKSQTCACEKEFLHVKNIVEHNFAGYADRVKALSKAGYEKKVHQLLQLTRNKFSSDNCPLIIYQYLKIFKSHHLGFAPNYDPAKTDTDFVNHRPVYNITDEEIARLKQSRSWEGIYYFTYDSSTKIAVIKDPTDIHDYIGVTIESTRPTWKKGLIKFEGKLENDSILSGLLYMRNHRPKFEGFWLHDNNNMISGDWRREGAPAPVKQAAANSSPGERIPTIHAKNLSANTFYLKIGSSDLKHKPAIDSILKANEGLLNSIPNLVLDFRDNGGGADATWAPLIPYLYTQPIKEIGADVWATELTIAGYKKYLEDKNLPQANRDRLLRKIAKMEAAKGKWIRGNEDEINSSFTAKPFPQKVVILINRWCGSATEEFLLAAQQSTKVILVGENTIGNLDYSNVVEVPFSCYPYTLTYATTRSRRLDMGQGIDNVGIAPKYRLAEEADWIQETLRILEH